MIFRSWGLAMALVVVAGCGEDRPPTPQSLPVVPSITIAPYDANAGLAAGKAALSLIPADAETVTITDFDHVRTVLGVPELTSKSARSDRNEFWERVRRESVVLTEPMLLDDNSTLLRDHGFGQDDVDWEAHFTTPTRVGWILAFRTDLDLAGVQGAVDAGVGGLAGGVVDPERHLVSVGAAGPDVDTWGTIEGIADLTSDAPAESTYYRAGCVPLTTALGPEADIEDEEAVVGARDPSDLSPLSGFSLSFTDGLATARLGLDRRDLFARAEFAEDFPDVGPLGFDDAFGEPVVDPSTGRLGLPVVDPLAANTATLAGLLPFAVCNEPTSQ